MWQLKPRSVQQGFPTQVENLGKAFIWILKYLIFLSRKMLFVESRVTTRRHQRISRNEQSCELALTWPNCKIRAHAKRTSKAFKIFLKHLPGRPLKRKRKLRLDSLTHRRDVFSRSLSRDPTSSTYLSVEEGRSKGWIFWWCKHRVAGVEPAIRSCNWCRGIDGGSRFASELVILLLQKSGLFPLLEDKERDWESGHTIAASMSCNVHLYRL